MSHPWVSKLCISPNLVFCTILEITLRSFPTSSAICSWSQLLQKDGGQALQKDGGQALQKDGGQARRFKRMK